MNDGCFWLAALPIGLLGGAIGFVIGAIVGSGRGCVEGGCIPVIINNGLIGGAIGAALAVAVFWVLRIKSGDPLG